MISGSTISEIRITKCVGVSRGLRSGVLHPSVEQEVKEVVVACPSSTQFLRVLARERATDEQRYSGLTQAAVRAQSAVDLSQVVIGRSTAQHCTTPHTTRAGE